MGILLYEHNQTAYSLALSLIKKTGKAAVIHPTGTGKSFIGFKLAEEHPSNRILWLSPSEYIVKTQLENLKREADTQLENIIFITYSKLMLFDSQEMLELQPDYIIFDEFHRCGASEWGKGVKRLLESFPDAGILGLSATNIRYLDNQRNMADELFDGNAASHMTLGEAIARNILPAPDYVISVYAYQKELQKYEERIDKITNSGIRDKNRRKLDALKRALEMADGLDKVFEKHIKNRSGKYIVFCSGKDHMEEMISHTGEWFGKIDSDMHIYRVYSQDPLSSLDFRKFKSDSSTHLKLLFCIDMLNEGVHVNDIDGVIMFRPTVSPIIYKQQIGRALSAGESKSPIIFDIVNNFDNLYSISSIQDEMQLAVSYYRDLGEEEKIVNESFNIIDETCDSRQLFRTLEKSLSSSWEIYFQASKEYFDTHKNLNVPKKFVTASGLSLGMWIATQRRVRKGTVAGKLTDAQIKRLDSIGMIWDNTQELHWENGFRHAAQYFEEYGNLDVRADYVSDDGFRLGGWISNNRTWHKNKSHSLLLNSDRINRLDQIGMIWSKLNLIWERNYEAAVKYFNDHGDLNVPCEYVTEDGLKLGFWINRLRSAKNKRNELSGEQIKKLELIGMVWDNRHDAKWNRGYSEARMYYRQYGNIDVESDYRTEDGFPLGKWIYNQRANTKLSEEKKKLLNDIHMSWRKDPWEERYSLAKDYYEKHGDLNIPQHYKTADNIWLGKWLYLQRKIYRKEINGDILSNTQIKKLEAIGMDWRTNSEKAWDKKYSEVLDYVKTYGNLDIPDSYISSSGAKLSVWLRNQRKKVNGNILTKSQKEQFLKLEEIVRKDHSSTIFKTAAEA